MDYLHLNEMNVLVWIINDRLTMWFGDLHQVANKLYPNNRDRIFLFVGSEELTEDEQCEKISIMRQTVPFWGGAEN